MAKAKSSPQGLRTRITGLQFLPGSALQDHAGNWRTHPQHQAEALEGVLRDVGIAGALLIYKSERQSGITVIDGHLRKGLHPAQLWPCLMTDLTDAEADYVLLTHDWLGRQAEAETEHLRELMAHVQSGEPSVQALIAAMGDDLLHLGTVVEPPDDFPAYDTDIDTEYCCPKCGYEWSGKPR